MARRLAQTMADYVVIAISPALIMTLVGSLVFFLLAVFYQGQFAGRLHWVMACFVFAAVLIGRISIEEGLERAIGFAIALAIPVGIASSRFMEIQGTWIDHFGFLINWALIGLIWWCAHRLTWDCTVIDDDQDASGEGLLQTAGLDEGASESTANKPTWEEALEGTTTRKASATWWQRYVERQHRPHAPGVWVVYFSLAALPLFGIGQWFIPATNALARRWTFWLLCVYVASGLGLLLTTSFLGLRRYLRQRRIEMPTLMANLWLGMGATIIVALLGFATLLPRPSAEYEISRLPFSVGSPSQHSSRVSPSEQEGTSDQQPGEGTNEKLKSDEADQNRADSEQSGGNQPDDGQPADGQSGSWENGSVDQESPSREHSKAGGSDESKSSQNGDQSRGSQQANSATDQSGAQKPSISGSQKQQSPENKQSKSAEDQSPKTDPQQGEHSKTEPFKPSPPDTQPAQGSNPAIPPPAAVIEPLMSTFSEIFRWAFYAIVIVAVLIMLWRSRAAVLAAIAGFFAALRDFWAGLFSGRAPRAATADAQAMHEQMTIARFSDYADPFASGVADRYSLAELVRYSFEAFEAWSREHGCPRGADATAHEMARQVSAKFPDLAADARNLAELYSRAAYARGELPVSGPEQLRQLWRQMKARAAAVQHFVVGP